MLVTGVLWGTWFSLSRSVETFSATEFLHIGKTMIGNLAVPMRVLMPVCVLFLLLATSRHPAPRSGSRLLTGLAALLTIAGMVVTLVVNVPIDNQIREWTDATIPSDWTEKRDRWQTFHTIRTFACLAAFGCLAVAVVFRRPAAPLGIQAKA